jgi:hypothetical protein
MGPVADNSNLTEIDGFLPKPAAAHFLGMSPRGIARLPIPRYVIGRRTFFQKSEIISYMNQHRVTTESMRMEKSQLAELADRAIRHGRKAVIK